MQTKTAKLFTNGGSHAVRLPAEFRFEGDEVFVRRDERTGDVILSKAKAGCSTWDEYFALRDADLPVPKEFMATRPMNEPLNEKALFGEED